MRLAQASILNSIRCGVGTMARLNMEFQELLEQISVSADWYFTVTHSHRDSLIDDSSFVVSI